MYCLSLLFLFLLLDLDDLNAFIGATGQTNVVRQTGFMTLGAIDQMWR